MSRFSFLWIGLLLAIAGGAGRAQSFSLVGDWNFASDSTSNLWAYGTSSGAFNGTNFIIPATLYKSTNGNEQFWLFPPSAGGTDPNIEKNTGTTDILTAGADFRPGTVSFGPFRGPAIAQFTAPSAGLFNISATFQTDQIRGTSTGDGTTASVYIGGAQVFTQVLADPGHAQFGTAYTYTGNSISLTQGETVDFVLGNGAFTTQVDATLEEVPEPSTWAMVLLGSALAACAFRRRLAAV